MISGGGIPFILKGKSKDDLIYAIENSQYNELPPEIPKEYSALVWKMLNKNEAERPTIKDLIFEPIIKEQIIKMVKSDFLP
jgi:serine/threonine protein kinase